jgi:hypothetical protein
MLPFYTDRSPQLFREALRKTKALMDTSSSLLKNYLNVYAWNEWNEGGVIEPNEKDGDAYLSAIGDVFALPHNRCSLTQRKRRINSKLSSKRSFGG